MSVHVLLNLLKTLRKSDKMRGFWPDVVSLVRAPVFFCSSIQLFVLLSPYHCFITFLYLDLYVLGVDASLS